MVLARTSSGLLALLSFCSDTCFGSEHRKCAHSGLVKWLLFRTVGISGACLSCLLGWIALLIITHSSWIRIGSIFGIIWAFFMTMHIAIYSFSTDLALLVHALINAATCIALAWFLYLPYQSTKRPLIVWMPGSLGLPPP